MINNDDGSMPESASLYWDGWLHTCECGSVSFWLLGGFTVCQSCKKGVAMMGNIPIHPNWEINEWPKVIGEDGQPVYEEI